MAVGRKVDLDALPVAFMAAGGRRLVVLRELAGLPLVPRSFESGGL